MAEGKTPMEVDSSDGSNSNAQSSKLEKAAVVTPVSACTSGSGLPYAPEGWPLPGDVWTWKVGKRKSLGGHFLDRSVFPPSRLNAQYSNSKSGFYSRLSLKQFITKEFPKADLEAFFASFTWKVPCAGYSPREGEGLDDDEENIELFKVDWNINKDAEDIAIDEEDRERKMSIPENSRSLDFNGCTKSEPATAPWDCKAGNNMCSLRAKGRSYALGTKPCDICCSEIGFCRDCCCILCCKTVDWKYGAYSFIRCEAKVDETFICGHVAHMDCALRAYMAGTVGGSIGLDVSYYCRRCDNRTDLLLHVGKLIKTCESLDSRDEVEKILTLGLCILRGSEKERAKDFRNRITSLMAKLKLGVSLGGIWKEEDNVSTLTAGDTSFLGNEVTVLGAVDMTINNWTSDFMNDVEHSETDTIEGRALRPLYITSDHSNVSLKIEDEVDGVLHKMKRSQESEYTLAEQKLYAQKDLLLGLYQQLEAERSELARLSPLPNGSDNDDLLRNVLNRVDQIKHEEAKLQQMMKIANGFGQTPKTILTECFGLPFKE